MNQSKAEQDKIQQFHPNYVNQAPVMVQQVVVTEDPVAKSVSRVKKYVTASGVSSLVLAIVCIVGACLSHNGWFTGGARFPDESTDESFNVGIEGFKFQEFGGPVIQYSEQSYSFESASKAAGHSAMVLCIIGAGLLVITAITHTLLLLYKMNKAKVALYGSLLGMVGAVVSVIGVAVFYVILSKDFVENSGTNAPSSLKTTYSGFYIREVNISAVPGVVLALGIFTFIVNALSAHAIRRALKLSVPTPISS